MSTFAFPDLSRAQARKNRRSEQLFLLAKVFSHITRIPIPLVQGEFTFRAYDVDGRLVGISPTYRNLIVTVGKDLILDRLFAFSGPPANIGNVGVGTDNTAAAVGQTKLNPSVSGSVLLQTADAGASRTAEVATTQSTFGTGVANFAWAEAGLFNGNTNGTSTMLNRVVIGPFTKSSAVSIVAQFQITQA